MGLRNRRTKSQDARRECEMIKEPKYQRYTICTECGNKVTHPFLIQGNYKGSNFLNMVLCKECYDYIFTDITIRKSIERGDK
jgi:hypothetical protein